MSTRISKLDKFDVRRLDRAARVLLNDTQVRRAIFHKQRYNKNVTLVRLQEGKVQQMLVSDFALMCVTTSLFARKEIPAENSLVKWIQESHYPYMQDVTTAIRQLALISGMDSKCLGRIRPEVDVTTFPFHLTDFNENHKEWILTNFHQPTGTKKKPMAKDVEYRNKIIEGIEVILERHGVSYFVAEAISKDIQRELMKVGK